MDRYTGKRGVKADRQERAAPVASAKKVIRNALKGLI